MNLTALANRYGSDKGTVSGSPPHKYSYLYDLIFAPFRYKNINFLEMGLAVGGPEVGGPVERLVDSPSVQMWLEYFSDAIVFGFDISDFSHIKHPRFRFLRGDSGSSADMARLTQAAPYFDIIIDDASHASFHQQTALKHLWPKLASGGLYVIEDLQWQSPAFEASLPPVPKTGELLESFLERDEYRPGAILDQPFLGALKHELGCFAIFHAFDGAASPIKQIVLQKA